MTKINEGLLNRVVNEHSSKLRKMFKDRGYSVNESRLRDIALMAHTRKIYESASNGANVPGRGAFSFGSATERGSAEMFDRLFTVFVDTAATNVGFDLLHVAPMTKSNITMVVAEPVYAGGKKESANGNHLQVFQIKAKAMTSADPLKVGTKYEIKETGGATKVAEAKFIGIHQYNGNFIFDLVSVEATHKDKVLAEILENAEITSGSGKWVLSGNTVDYVNGFTNFIAGFAGSGLQNNDPFHVGRNNGKSLFKPMSREVGETQGARTLGTKMWNRTFSAETFHVDLSLTTEQIQDARMDHDFDMLEFSEEIMKNDLDQSINDHILSMIFASGWDHHVAINKLSNINLNANFGTGTGATQEFVGLDGELKQISGATSVLPAVGAIAENLSTLQKRIITRMFFASTIIKNRGRAGAGNTAVVNGTNSTAIRDVRGFAIAPFENTLQTQSSLAHLGQFYGIDVFEDGLMDLNDCRVAVFNKGGEKTPGLAFCPYILGEKVETVAEGTMEKKFRLKSRYVIAERGSHPEAQYMTFVVEGSDKLV